MTPTFLISSSLALFLSFFLVSCVRGSDQDMMLFECEKQNSGEACNKLGMKREGEEALRYFRLGCEKQSTVSCLSLAERTTDQAEALRVLKQACEWKNATACSKVEALASPGSAAGVDTGGGAGKPPQPPAGAASAIDEKK